MKDIIKNILKEEQEHGELEQRFRNSMAKSVCSFVLPLVHLLNIKKHC